MAQRVGNGEQALRERGVLIVEQGGRGGIADYSGCLARALTEHGLRVTVATARDHLYGVIPGVRIVPVFGYVRGHSRAARVARRLGFGRLLNGLWFLLVLPRLAALARRSAIVHVQGWERTSLGLIATLVLLAGRARIVYTGHNTFERLARGLNGAPLFAALARATIVHTISDRDRLTRPVTVIPHGHYAGVAAGARPVSPAPARGALCLPVDALVVLVFGVLRPDKGISDLLRALGQAPGWLAVIAGEEDGGLHAARELLNASDLAGRVTVREGFQDIDAVAALFAAADLIALPYSRASQSGVLHLAYGFSRPVVAYPVGGLTEAVIDGQTGWVCSQPTPAALAAALREAAAAGRVELRRRGAEGRRWAAANFDWGSIALDTEGVYRAALAR
ncbi:MAG: glycosyltransferase family 4 protein [Solirubrobacteraceae bacterium]|jgi:glycosyltransferase involved in cell wall biosynthesis